MRNEVVLVFWTRKGARLMGTGIGPAAVTPGIVSPSGSVTSNVSGVTVTIGGVAAPLLSVSSTEIDCIAPFEIANQTTVPVQLQYNGALSNVGIAQVLADLYPGSGSLQ
jgi:uncharacterized protein (TIGR03437 family)